MAEHAGLELFDPYSGFSRILGARSKTLQKTTNAIAAVINSIFSLILKIFPNIPSKSKKRKIIDKIVLGNFL